MPGRDDDAERKRPDHRSGSSDSARSRGGASGRRAAGDRSTGAPRDGVRRHAAGPRDAPWAERHGGASSGGRSRSETGRTDSERPRASVRHDEPDIPDDVRPNDLEKSARIELKTLSKENADEVARHLAMASQLIEEDPALAHRHALAAGRRAGRIAIVRESVAITAYAVGDFALALRELRTFRRISGSDDQIALMVDSERGLGRPDRALELGRTVDRAVLPLAAQVGLAIAMSGARLDLGDPEAALDELERAPLDVTRLYPWSPALYGAFAAVHEDLGHTAEAAHWDAMAEQAEERFEMLDAEDDSIEITTEEFPAETETDPDRDPGAQVADAVLADDPEDLPRA